MTFFNRLWAVLPSFGSPIQNDTLFLKQGVSLSGTTFQTTSFTSLAPTFSKGYVRVKIYGAGGTSPTLLNLQVVAYDGTNAILIGCFTPVVATAPAFGTAVGGTQLVTNGSITSGQAILTTATAGTFTPAMVGQPIAVSGAGAAGATLLTTVLSYQSGTQVTLSANAGTTVAGTATVTLTSFYFNSGTLATPTYGGVDFLFPFEIDLLAANQISILTTLGGTTPTALMDAEVSATS